MVLNHFCCLWPANLTEPIYRGQAAHQTKRKIDKDDTVKTNPRKKAKNSTAIAGGKSTGSTTLFGHFDVKVSPSSNTRPKKKQRSTTDIKEQKQITCHNWLRTMKQNENVVSKFEKALILANEIEGRRRMMLNSVGLKAGLSEGEVLQVFSVLQEMIDRTEMDSQSKEVNFNAQTCQTRNTAEMKWTE